MSSESQTPIPGSKQMPLVVEAGEVARLSYHVWRGEKEKIYFQIRLQSGDLSELIEFANPHKHCHEKIFATCTHCGEKAQATVFFF